VLLNDASPLPARAGDPGGNGSSAAVTRPLTADLAQQTAVLRRAESETDVQARRALPLLPPGAARLC